MRIKFRTWNWREKKMEEGIHWQFICSKDVWASDPDGALNSTIGGLNIFTQWTGLKDKNGVDIYEGDIVNALVDFGPAGEELRTYAVKMTPFGVNIQEWNFKEDQLPEVIGNIYSNPELLK